MSEVELVTLKQVNEDILGLQLDPEQDKFQAVCNLCLNGMCYARSLPMVVYSVFKLET